MASLKRGLFSFTQRRLKALGESISVAKGGAFVKKLKKERKKIGTELSDKFQSARVSYSGLLLPKMTRMAGPWASGSAL